MKTKIKCLFLGALVIVTTLSIGFSGVANSGNISTTSVPLVSSQISFYTLKENNGFLAIFDSTNSTVPIKTLDVYVADLPERDITKLTNGIKANTIEEIMKIVEDYE